MRPIDYSKLSESTKDLLTRAHSTAREYHYEDINTLLLLIAMVQQSREMLRFVLEQIDVEYVQFCTRLSHFLQSIPRHLNIDPIFSESANRIVVNAINSYRIRRRGLVPPEALLLEMANTNNEASTLFQEFNITKHNLSDAIEAYSAGNILAQTEEGNSVTLTNLEHFAINLRKQAEEGNIQPVIGRDSEIRRILQTLSRKTKNNPILIGEPGTGKTAIVEGLAYRLNRGDVPQDIKNIQLYCLDIATLIAGASVQGEFESRLKSIVMELKSAPNVILFIDEIHSLLGAGSNGGAMDAATILKPELARNGVKIIGATTFDEYNKFIESDQAFARRFQRIIIDEPSIESTISILRGIKSRFESHHKIKILDEAIIASALLSAKYITDRFLPDKAIDILDETASRMRMDRFSVPYELDFLSRSVRQKEIELESLLQDGIKTSHIFELEQEISSLKEQENVLNAKWVNERRQLDRLQDYQDDINRLKENRINSEAIGRYDEAARYNREIEQAELNLSSLLDELSTYDSRLLKLALDSNDVKETITNLTGIPITSMSNDELNNLNSISDFLNDRVKGQSEAVQSICNIIKRSRLGLGNDNAPIGSFLFMGTTGVGKTELAKSLAEFLFGCRDMLIRIDMSEYQQEHNVARLFGAPPGYIGYEQGGQLTEAVRRKPYSVILLDEIEKAHPKVCETLLQVLDDGRMTDGKGRIINFKNTVIIMTSNIGAEIINANENQPSSTLREMMIQMLIQRTSPEFVNRIDDILIFKPLSESVLKSIATKTVHDTVRKLYNSGYAVNIENSVSEFIASDIDTSMGARPIKRIVDHLIIDGIVDRILKGDLTKEAPIKIEVDNNSLIFTNE